MCRDDTLDLGAVLGLLQHERVDQDALIGHGHGHALELDQLSMRRDQLLQDRGAQRLALPGTFSSPASPRGVSGKLWCRRATLAATAMAHIPQFIVAFATVALACPGAHAHIVEDNWHVFSRSCAIGLGAQESITYAFGD